MSRPMGIRGLFISTAVITLLGVAACGDEDDPAGAGGNAGTSGRGGSSGAAGSGGSSGAAGSNGSSGAAGSGGSSGAAGSSGTGGAAGADAGDGSSGSSGTAGSSGTGGMDGGSDSDAPLPRDCTPTPSELELLKTLGPVPATVPADTTNRVANSAAAAALGQKLFFDQNFSGPMQIDNDLGTTGQSGKVSCASCHSSSYLDDARSMPRTVSQGTNFHTRNSPTLVNASFYKWIGWGGRFAAQWELPLAVVENAVIMNGNRLKVAHRIFDVYKSEYETVFTTTLEPELAGTTRFPADGKPGVPAWDNLPDPDKLIVNTILVNYSKAIAAYMRLLVSRDAPFDAWIASNGTGTSITAAAACGAKLFVGKARCVSCHSGPHLTDDKFHNLGVPQQGERVPATDDGRAANAPQLLGSPLNVNGAYSDDTNTGRLAGLTNPMPAETKGAFRTPGLRGVALTAPYMHSGQAPTLEDVVDFYNRGGGTPAAGQTKDSQMFPLGLTAGEQADLVAFLKTLTGAAVPPALLVDSTP